MNDAELIEHLQKANGWLTIYRELSEQELTSESIAGMAEAATAAVEEMKKAQAWADTNAMMRGLTRSVK